MLKNEFSSQRLSRVVANEEKPKPGEPGGTCPECGTLLDRPDAANKHLLACKCGKFKRFLFNHNLSDGGK